MSTRAFLGGIDISHIVRQGTISVEDQVGAVSFATLRAITKEGRTFIGEAEVMSLGGEDVVSLDNSLGATTGNDVLIIGSGEVHQYTDLKIGISAYEKKLLDTKPDHFYPFSETSGLVAHDYIGGVDLEHQRTDVPPRWEQPPPGFSLASHAVEGNFVAPVGSIPLAGHDAVTFSFFYNIPDETATGSHEKIIFNVAPGIYIHLRQRINGILDIQAFVGALGRRYRADSLISYANGWNYCILTVYPQPGMARFEANGNDTDITGATQHNYDLAFFDHITGDQSISSFAIHYRDAFDEVRAIQRQLQLLQIQTRVFGGLVSNYVENPRPGSEITDITIDAVSYERILDLVALSADISLPPDQSGGVVGGFNSILVREGVSADVLTTTIVGAYTPARRGYTFKAGTYLREVLETMALEDNLTVLYDQIYIGIIRLTQQSDYRPTLQLPITPRSQMRAFKPVRNPRGFANRVVVIGGNTVDTVTDTFMPDADRTTVFNLSQIPNGNASSRSYEIYGGATSPSLFASSLVAGDDANSTSGLLLLGTGLTPVAHTVTLQGGRTAVAYWDIVDSRDPAGRIINKIPSSFAGGGGIQILLSRLRLLTSVAQSSLGDPPNLVELSTAISAAENNFLGFKEGVLADIDIYVTDGQGRTIGFQLGDFNDTTPPYTLADFHVIGIDDFLPGSNWSVTIVDGTNDNVLGPSGFKASGRPPVFQEGAAGVFNTDGTFSLLRNPLRATPTESQALQGNERLEVTYSFDRPFMKVVNSTETGISIQATHVIRDDRLTSQSAVDGVAAINLAKMTGAAHIYEMTSHPGALTQNIPSGSLLVVTDPVEGLSNTEMAVASVKADIMIDGNDPNLVIVEHTLRASTGGVYSTYVDLWRQLSGSVDTF